jgi:hypothetical protein
VANDYDWDAWPHIDVDPIWNLYDQNYIRTFCYHPEDCSEIPQVFKHDIDNRVIKSRRFTKPGNHNR